MANGHPDAPKQLEIRLSDETMEMASAIQQFCQNNQAINQLPFLLLKNIPFRFTAKIWWNQVRFKMNDDPTSLPCWQILVLMLC